MAGSMADNWRKIGSTSADDMAMKICYSVIVQNWAMAVGRFWSEWQQFALGRLFCCHFLWEGGKTLWQNRRRRTERHTCGFKRRW